jgi:hypothetical protein
MIGHIIVHITRTAESALAAHVGIALGDAHWDGAEGMGYSFDQAVRMVRCF